MKQFYTIIILLGLSTLNTLSGQIVADSIYRSWYQNKERSIFKEVDHGTFTGTTNGFVQLKNGDDTLVLDFQSTSANLKITKDVYEVYDNSTKKHTTQTTSGKTTVSYETYAMGNILTINLNGLTYSIGIIDGASDTPIAGLTFNYCSENNTEYLTLFVTKPLELTTTRDLAKTKKISYSEAEKQAKSITILPGTTLILTIKK